MRGSETLDSLFQRAVSAIDAGDVAALERLLADHPELLRERLDTPGAWLRAEVGGALEGYFQRPYLLWFVAGNPVRRERLPANIVEMTRALVRAAERAGAADLVEQLTYTLGLVSTGRVPRESGVQLELIDLLIDAGARPGDGLGALAHRNLDALRRLIERGGELTLAAALCLGRTDDVRRLTRAATPADRQIALAAAALLGMTPELGALIELGVDLDAYSTGIHPHATALHHAVDSGSLAAVQVLVEAGAALDTRDRVYGGTPLDWAEHAGNAQIAAYLRTAERRRAEQEPRA